MTPEVMTLLTSLGAVVGGGTAQLCGPLSCGWPANGDELMLRMKSIGRSRPGFARAVLGGSLIATLVGAGTLTAYAAAPAAPAPAPAQALPADLMRLAREAAGVVGSGDRLSLQIKPADVPTVRTLNIGEEYADGWRLQAVTPTVATLVKAGQIQRVGLNPNGVVASLVTFTPLSSVEVDLSAQERAELAALIASGRWDGQILPSLSEAETQRHVLLETRIEALGRATLSGPMAKVVGTPSPTARVYPSEIMMRQVFGNAAIDQRAAEDDRIREARLDVQRADIAARPISGPSSYYVAAGEKPADVMAQASVDPRGVWLASLADASGGVTYHRVGDVNDLPTRALVSAEEHAKLAAQRAATGQPPPPASALPPRPLTCAVACPTF
ncbi:MAG: hypothetical protein JWM33_3307 [Caulobacteraceae bacterium]|nr:hypothetical protein [Caulobacteraceae bacterium]